MYTTKEVFEKVEIKLRDRSHEFTHLRAVYKFVLNGPDGGTWIVDLRAESFGVRKSEEEAQCTFKASDENFIKLIKGKLGPEKALLTGKVKLAGDIGLAMKFGELLKR